MATIETNIISQDGDNRDKNSMASLQNHGPRWCGIENLIKQIKFDICDLHIVFYSRIHTILVLK